MSLLDPSCHACGAEVYDIDVRCRECGASLSTTAAQRMIGGRVLGQYEIVDVLGQGGMSVVYKGKHDITGQEVALKILPPELAAHRDVKGRFLEEGRALAQLDHPNIVHLYNFGDDNGCLVLAMQFVRGETWERMIMDRVRLPWPESVGIAKDVASALEYAHSRGIIHRDMKPSNVLVRQLDGAATVMDFGIAKMHSSSKLTATGQTMGTVRYMSPEQVRGQAVDARTDIYSLAVTLYESLVGDTPFDGETHFEIMSKHLNETPAAPGMRGVECPPALEAALARAMAKTPEARQPTVAHFRQQLEAIASGRPIEIEGTAASGADAWGAAASAESRSDSRRSAFQSRRWALALAVVVALAGGATVFALWSAPPKARETRGAEPGQAASGAAVLDGAPDKDILDRAYLLPGLEVAADERFAGDKLRIVSAKPRDLGKVRDIVVEARRAFETYGSERSWPEARFAHSPLTLVLAPREALCDAGLYESKKPPHNCEKTTDYYRARERTLYVALGDDASLRQRVGYWVAASCCLDSAAADCAERVKGYVRALELE